jgi:hypothetical protein
MHEVIEKGKNPRSHAWILPLNHVDGRCLERLYIQIHRKSLRDYGVVDIAMA